MSKIKSIELYRKTIEIICGALNAEAAKFDRLAADTRYAPQNRSMFEATANDRRNLSRELLEQWDAA
jgi:hypothetical protein